MGRGWLRPSDPLTSKDESSEAGWYEQKWPGQAMRWVKLFPGGVSVSWLQRNNAAWLWANLSYYINQAKMYLYSKGSLKEPLGLLTTASAPSRASVCISVRTKTLTALSLYSILPTLTQKTKIKPPPYTPITLGCMCHCHKVMQLEVQSKPEGFWMQSESNITDTDIRMWKQ